MRYVPVRTSEQVRHERDRFFSWPGPASTHDITSHSFTIQRSCTLMSLTVAHSFPVWLPQTQTWLYNQVRFLPSEVRSHILCKELQHPEQFQLPDIHSLCGPSSRLTRLSTRLFRHMDYHLFVRHKCHRLVPEVLHSHFGPVGWKNDRVMRLFPSTPLGGMKHVVTFYGQDVDHLPKVDPAWKARYLQMFERVDMVLCEGTFMAAKVQALGCPEDRIRVHHLGVDLDTIAFEPRTIKHGEPFRVLMAAAFRPKKGFLYGLKALEQVAGEFEVEVTLVGDAIDDPASLREKQLIREFLERSPLGGRVTLTGFLTAEKLHAKARGHHIYLAPSVTAEDGDSEGGAPVSLIEMAAGGMPVVSSRHCDIPEVVRHGHSGLLAEERDVDGLASCLKQLMSDPETWQVMTRNARQHIEAQYNALTQGENLYNIYKMI